MLEAFILLRGIAIGLLLSLIVMALIYSRSHYAGRTLIFFSACVICYLLAPILYQQSDLYYLTDPVSNMTPLAFLLFTQALFEDHAKPARTSIVVGLFYMLLTYGGVTLRGETLFATDIGTLLWQAGRVVMFCLLIYSIFVVVRQWREDLIEPRRFLRLVVTCIVGFSILVVVVAETVFGYQTFSLWLNLIHTTLIIGFIFIFGIGLLLLGPSQFAQAQPTSTSKSSLTSANEEPSKADELEAQQIVDAMQSKKLYRDMQLSIRSLAKQLNIPEHRLRKHINTQLGYRNFNDFLNQYRINEVSEKLDSIEMARTPVLTIAMDAGYRSLTTFNKAFKSLKGVTPKEYRKKHL